MTPFKLGLRTDEDGRYRDICQPFANLRSRLPSEPRGFADLSPYAPRIKDQNGVGSCVMNGVPSAAVTTLAAQGSPLPFDPSTREGYAMALGLDRAKDNPFLEPKDLPLLVDIGTMLFTGVKVLSDWGVVAAGPNVVVNEVEYECDCGPGNYWREADLVTLQKASRKLIVGAHQVEWSNMETQIQLGLDVGHATVLANFVDVRHFMRYTGTSAPIGAQDLTDPDGGGHCTYVVGYKTDAAGVTIYDCINSWGTTWGRMGHFQATGEFVRQAWDAIVMDVRLKT